MFDDAKGNAARVAPESENKEETESWACGWSLQGNSSSCLRWGSWERYEPQEPICWVLFDRQKPRVFGWMEMNWLQRNRALSLSDFLFNARQARSRAGKVCDNPRERPREDSILSAGQVCKNANALDEVNRAGLKGLLMTRRIYLLYQSLTEWWAI